MMKRAQPYKDTKVAVSKSREEIAKLLAVGWGARGLMWEDDYDTGATTLRFRWRAGDSDEPIIVRLRLTPVAANVKARNAAEREHLRERENRRLHRIAFWWLKSMAEAVAAGLLDREAVLLPWVETPKGQTVSELLLPRLAAVSGGSLLALPEGTR